MKRNLLWITIAAITLAALWAVTVPNIADVDGMSGVFVKAASETRQVGVAAKGYADDHQGRLPQSLDDLAPNYLLDKTLLSGVVLATPRAVLSELHPDSVIHFRVVTDNRRRETRLIVVHPDISVKRKRS